MTLDELVNELLDIERREEIERPSILQRIGMNVHNAIKRREVEKAIQDQAEFERKTVISLGEKAQAFLKSVHYRDLVEPFIRSNVKSGLQNILANENMTIEEIKMEISKVKTCLRLLASLKLKILQAETEKGEKR